MYLTNLRLIAIMLGTFQMDVDTCIQKYLVMAPEIFPEEGLVSKSKPSLLFKGATGMARFDPKPLERNVKDLTSAKFKEAGSQAVFDVAKSSVDQRSCKVSVQSAVPLTSKSLTCI